HPRGRINTGPDGNLWFAAGPQIGRMTPQGDLSVFNLLLSVGDATEGITTGPDGNLWFTQLSPGEIGRLDPDQATPSPIEARAGITIRAPQGAFDGTLQDLQAGAFTATIDWGDGTPTTTGEIAANTPGSPHNLVVYGTHTYS